jgi:acyl carrier protein
MGELLRMEDLPQSVETVNLAGEPLAASLVREILRRGRVQRVFDLYGPTEDTTYSTCSPRSGEGPVTIGRPISNKRVYILDAHVQPLPIGVPGDLYVAGAGVARGYLNRPELTSEKFLADPFHPGERMYRTGDRARFLPDGNIQFLGRLDNQVKIRGYRIEIGEIEKALARHPGIRACAVAARHDQRGSKRQVAYIVPSDGEAPTVAQLRDFLKESLAGYMVPSVFVLLQALPLTPNGKVDREALLAPEQTRPELGNAFVPPRNPVEETVAGIWRQVLGLEKVGIHDNFFELGGHSLLATRVFARLQKAFPLAPPLRTLFEKPTVAELSTAVEDLGQAGSGSSHSPVLPVSRQAQSPKPSDPLQEPSWTATTKGPLENG